MGIEPLRFAEGDAAFGMLERTPKAPVHRGRSSAPKAVFGHFLTFAKAAPDPSLGAQPRHDLTLVSAALQGEA